MHLQRKLPSRDRDWSYDGDWWGRVTYVKVRNVQVRICGGAKSSGLVVVFAGAGASEQTGQRSLLSGEDSSDKAPSHSVLLVAAAACCCCCCCC